MNLSVFNKFLLIALLILVVLLIRFFIGREFCVVAEEKGYKSNKYLWWILFTGIAGMLLVTSLPDRGEDRFASLPMTGRPFQAMPDAQTSSGAEPVYVSPAAASARPAARHMKPASDGTASGAAKSGASRRSLEAQDCDSLPRL